MSVSHELRTPLTTIRGYAEALADGVVGVDGAQRAGQTMLAESEHLDRLIEDLLVLARLEADDFPLEVMQVDLTALVASAAAVVGWAVRRGRRGAAHRTARAAGRRPDRPGPHPAGHRRPAGERACGWYRPGAPVVLAVRAGTGGVDETTLALPVAGHTPPDGRRGVNQPYALLEVRDGGPGFTDDDLAVVFERGALYERYKGIRKVGSGMGLALAARLVIRLGGRIQAGHAPEGGARITVQVPI